MKKFLAEKVRKIYKNGEDFWDIPNYLKFSKWPKVMYDGSKEDLDTENFSWVSITDDKLIISALSDTANSVDNTINTLIQRIVQLYLKNISPIIDSSYFYMNDRNDHVYFIIPKEDNAENRDAIFGFFEEYNSYPISGKFPVTFQVVPPDLKNRLPFDLLKKTNA